MASSDFRRHGQISPPTPPPILHRSTPPPPPSHQRPLPYHPTPTFGWLLCFFHPPLLDDLCGLSFRHRPSAPCSLNHIIPTPNIHTSSHRAGHIKISPFSVTTGYFASASMVDVKAFRVTRSPSTSYRSRCLVLASSPPPVDWHVIGRLCHSTQWEQWGAKEKTPD
jgi:hypothetical protein